MQLRADSASPTPNALVEPDSVPRATVAASAPVDAQPTLALLTMRGVSKDYRRGSQLVLALRGVDLAVGAGEFVALTGPSGSGKSTLLHLAGGLDIPDTGTVFLGDQDLAALSGEERASVRRRKIGFVFQFFHLLSGLSVLENVALPLVLDGVADAEARAAALVERVGLGHRRTYRPTELSGGEMQRVAIARALVNSPRVILADEPTGNLDSATGDAIMDLLVEQVSAVGSALLLVTHDSRVASRAHRTVEVRDGRIA